MPHAGDIYDRLETMPDGQLSELAARYERLAAEREAPHSRYAAIALRARVILFTRTQEEPPCNTPHFSNADTRA